MKTRNAIIGLLCSASLACNAAATLVTFDDGPEGWLIQGAATVEDTGGNPGAFLSHYQINTFGISILNATTPEFIGDYGAKGPVDISIDLKVNRVWDSYVGDLDREFLVEFRNYGLGDDGYQFASVWTKIGVMSSGMDWTTLGTTISDPNATTLPDGWGGTGSEDPVTFEPILPAGVTFADVLSDVDLISFTTFVPGYYFGFTHFDFGVDNISITPTPGAASLFALAGVACGRRRR